jgi:hypothetical protein
MDWRWWKRANVGIAHNRGGHPADENGYDAGAGNNSRMAGGIKYARCWWHLNLLIDLDQGSIDVADTAGFEIGGHGAIDVDVGRFELDLGRG